MLTPARLNIPMPTLLSVARTLLVALAIAQIADIFSTNAALAATPGASEGNPFMRLVMSGLGSWWWLWKVALAALFIVYAMRLNVVRRKTVALLGVVAKAYAIVIMSNMLGWL